MSYYFYLSCARHDNRQLIARFFEDLSDSVQMRLGESQRQQVGFYDGRGIASNSEWTGELAEALRASQTLVSLSSPSLLRSERCGREWQIFRTRSEVHRDRIPSGAPSVIIPVHWVPCPLPPEVDTLIQLVYRGSHATQAGVGILRMLESLSTFHKQYSQLVEFLAEYIVASAQTVRLTPLDRLPPEKQVSNAFFEERGSTSMIERSAKPPEKLKALIIDDHDQVRDFIVEACRFSDFEADGYDEAETVLYEVFDDPYLRRMPDLFVVDLELKPGKMQGIDLICELADRSVPSAMLAVSGNQPSGSLLRAIEAGALDTANKPFDLNDLVKQMRYCATIGRKRRLHEQSNEPTLVDPVRRQRPVFLSYADEDKRIANGLKVKIEATGIPVWYAPTALQPGDDWRALIQTGVDEAQVFVALITSNYLNSPACSAEFNRFYERLEKEASSPPILLPVLYGDSAILRVNPLIRRPIEKYQWVRMTPERVVDAYTAILLRVQSIVKSHSIW